MLSVGVWTKVMMWSRIAALKSAEKEILKGASSRWQREAGADASADPLKNNGRVEVDTIILEWLALHRGRIALVAVAFGLAVTELVAA